MANENLKRTVLAYQQNLTDYEQKRQLNPNPDTKLLEKFTTHGNLKRTDQVLEIGPGLGFEAKWLANHYSYTAIEPARRFAVPLSQLSPPLRIIQTRIQDVNLPHTSFNGIWAMNSLIHLSNPELQSTLSNIYNWLVPGGIFYASMEQGNFKGQLPDGRFINRVTNDEFLTLCPLGLKLVESFTTLNSPHNPTDPDTLNYYFKKTK